MYWLCSKAPNSPLPPIPNLFTDWLYWRRSKGTDARVWLRDSLLRPLELCWKALMLQDGLPALCSGGAFFRRCTIVKLQGYGVWYPVWPLFDAYVWQRTEEKSGEYFVCVAAWFQASTAWQGSNAVHHLHPHLFPPHPCQFWSVKN